MTSSVEHPEQMWIHEIFEQIWYKFGKQLKKRDNHRRGT